MTAPLGFDKKLTLPVEGNSLPNVKKNQQGYAIEDSNLSIEEVKNPLETPYLHRISTFVRKILSDQEMLDLVTKDLSFEERVYLHLHLRQISSHIKSHNRGVDLSSSIAFWTPIFYCTTFTLFQLRSSLHIKDFLPPFPWENSHKQTNSSLDALPLVHLYSMTKQAREVVLSRAGALEKWQNLRTQPLDETVELFSLESVSLGDLKREDKIPQVRKFLELMDKTNAFDKSLFCPSPTKEFCYAIREGKQLCVEEKNSSSHKATDLKKISCLVRSVLSEKSELAAHIDTFSPAEQHHLYQNLQNISSAIKSYNEKESTKALQLFLLGLGSMATFLTLYALAGGQWRPTALEDCAVTLLACALCTYYVFLNLKKDINDLYTIENLELYLDS